MDVYLVRHAIAFSRDPSRWPDDAERPLSPEGEERFRREARGLRGIVPSVDKVLSSGFARAWRTAEILSEEAGWPAPEACEPLEVRGSVADAVGTVRASAGVASVAMVGHEPNLSELAAKLLTGHDDGVFVEMKKGGVACLAFDGNPEAGRARLRWSLSPKILRALDPPPG